MSNKTPSSQRDPYFLKMQTALHEAGIAEPTLIIDLERLNVNIDTLMDELPDGMAYRIVAKSLPCAQLLAHIRDRSGTDRLMTFNRPMLQAISEAMPGADQMLGKPLPVAAARRYFEELGDADREAATNIQWLIDTPERLGQYAALASEMDVPLRIVLELDVGLHRGGFEPGDALNRALKTLRESNRMSFCGFVGYEPHIPHIPEAGGWRSRALSGAWDIYQASLAAASAMFDETHMAGITRNAAGSPTYRLYKDTSIANEVSVGSALVKPTDFDTDLLAVHQAACFIATPVLKAPPHTRPAGLEYAPEGFKPADLPDGREVFIYGGKWYANAVDPAGLVPSPFFGRSSNQEMLRGDATLDLKPDDFVFLRPMQSEAVFLQFGDIAIYEKGEIEDHWPVFSASA